MTQLPAATTDQNTSYVARYSAGSGDPFAAFATEGGPGIQGQLLTNAKGDWTIGQDKTPVKAGAEFLFVVPEMMRGWLKWVDSSVAEADMGYVRDNFLVKHRMALGDVDEDQWEKNPDGKPRDPWSRSYRALLIEMSPPHGDVTYSGSSFGTNLALKEICRIYSLDKHRFPDAFPVVQLTTKTRPHKHYGNIKGPWFTVTGWATVEDVRAGRKTGAAAKKTKAVVKPVATELSDELPNWDK